MRAINVEQHQDRNDIYRQFIPILGIILSGALARANAYAYFPIFLVENSAALWVSGLAVSLYFGAGVVGQYFGGLLYDRIGAKWVIALTTAGFAGSFAAATLSLAVYQLVFISLTGVFSFMLIPTFMAILQDKNPDDRSFVNGLFLGLMYSITALASVFSGYLLDRIEKPTVFIISAAACLVGIVFIPFLNNLKQN